MSENRYGSLLSEGFGAPDDVSEVRDAEGRVARIERHSSYPGAKRVYLDPPVSDAPFQAQWRLPASSTRPDFYPPGLPFIPDISSHVIEAEGRVMATWRDDACPRVSPDELEAIQASLPTELSELMSSVKHSSAKGRQRASEFVEGFKALRDRWSDEDVKEWLAGVSGPEALEERFVEAFQTALDQMAEVGWVEEPAQHVPSYAVELAHLRRGDRQRQLVLSATFGIGSLMLTETSVESLDSA